MTTPAKENYKIIQGSTFSEVLRWESYIKVYKPITNITKTAPVVLTVVGHGAPVGWRAKITNVGGMKEINDSSNYVVITETTVDTVTINSINAVSYSNYTSGGILEYNQPKSLAGMTARMQIRNKVSSSTTLLELTTENGMIILNDTNKTITLTIPASVTQTLAFKTAVYSLELVSGTTVVALVTGGITLESEITR